jgi:hypothetical protein
VEFWGRRCSEEPEQKLGKQRVFVRAETLTPSLLNSHGAGSHLSTRMRALSKSMPNMKGKVPDDHITGVPGSGHT